MVIRRLLRYALRHKKRLLIALLASILSSLMSVLSPLLAREAINILVRGELNNLHIYAIGIILLAIAQGSFSYLQRVNARMVSELVTFNLRIDLYNRIQDLSLSYLYRKGAGQLMARATADIDQVRRLFMFGLMGFVSALFTVSLALASMVSINIMLTLLTLAILSPITVIVRIFAKKIRKYFGEAREEYGFMTSILREVIVGLIAIKALVAEKLALERFNEKNETYRELMINVGKLRALVWPTLTLIMYFALVIIYWIGGSLAMEGEITVGDLVAFAMYILMLSWPLTAIGFMTVIVERARVAAARVFEIIDMEPEVIEDENAFPLKIEKGEIVIDNIWFSYDNKKWILRGLSFKIKPGEIVAVTGPPGSGKSTLTFLIPRLYDPQKGRIFIDGVDIRKVKLDSLRRQIAVVHQDIYLFPDTIKNNIAYAKPDASMEEIIKVAKLARIHEFISSLPEGYNTVIGEKGVTLSGGQRQRLAIARALLIDPKVIIFDDSTSEVDAETERAIYEALTKYFRGRTILVITQRPSTMKLADRVIIIRNGRVARDGRPEEILEEVISSGLAF